MTLEYTCRTRIISKVSDRKNSSIYGDRAQLIINSCFGSNYLCESAFSYLKNVEKYTTFRFASGHLHASSQSDPTPVLTRSPTDGLIPHWRAKKNRTFNAYSFYNELIRWVIFAKVLLGRVYFCLRGGAAIHFRSLTVLILKTRS